MSSDKTATIKRRIAPVTFTITVVAERVNENGTFSTFTVQSVKGPNKTAKIVAPPMAGGAIYIKVESLEGIRVLGDDDGKTGGAKVKLF